METENMISVQQFCIHHNVEIAFINSLNEYGLIEVTTVEETQYIYKGQLKDLERMIRLHYELDINVEGIDAIAHLLNKVEHLNSELMILKNKLGMYE